MLRREGEETTVSEKFFRAVAQVVLFLGADIWVLLETMTQKLEGVHVGLLSQVTRKKARRLRDGPWWQVT